MNSFNLGPLNFQASTLSLVFVALVILATAFLCLTAIRRSVRPKRTGTLELLRFLCVSYVCALLLDPEWRVTEISELQPEIAIIWDDSPSMTTEDARRPDSVAGTERVLTRRDLTDRLLNTNFFDSFEEGGKNRVTVTSFGALPENASANEIAMAGSEINAALQDQLDAGRNLRAAIYIGDGDWNMGGSPIEAAQKFAAEKIPLYTLVTGSEQRIPDLDLESVNAPTYGIIGENVQIPFTIQSSLNRDVRTQVRLRSSTGEEKIKDITLRANRPYYDSIFWRVEDGGPATLTLSVPVASDELLQQNNSREFILNSKPESIRVLVIETLPRWEYRFIRNALSRDPGVQVDCLLLHPSLGKGDGPDYIQEFPEKLEDLQKYDVVFIGDVGVGPGQLTVEQANLIKGLIENQASGVVFIPGPQGNQTTLSLSELGDLIPVVIDEENPEGFGTSTESSMRLTTAGESSLLTMLGDDEAQNETIWRNLPGFYWQAAVERAKSGSVILAVNDDRGNQAGRLPILVTARAGSGKVLYMAIDSAWRWRRGVEDLYHYRFWGQVARWMSYQRNMAAGERVRLFYTPERPKPGDIVSLSANAFDPNGAPLQDGVVEVDLKAPNGQLSRIGLTKDDSGWGTFSGQFDVSQPGTWELNAFISGDSSTSVEAKIISQTDMVEKIGLPARFDVLEEMAKITKGRIVSPGQLADLVKEINALPEPQPLVTSIKLWATWPAPTILIILLVLFWTGRKFNGTF